MWMLQDSGSIVVDQNLRALEFTSPDGQQGLDTPSAPQIAARDGEPSEDSISDPDNIHKAHLGEHNSLPDDSAVAIISEGGGPEIEDPAGSIAPTTVVTEEMPMSPLVTIRLSFSIEPDTQPLGVGSGFAWKKQGSDAQLIPTDAANHTQSTMSIPSEDAPSQGTLNYKEIGLREPGSLHDAQIGSLTESTAAPNKRDSGKENGAGGQSLSTQSPAEGPSLMLKDAEQHSPVLEGDQPRGADLQESIPQESAFRNEACKAQGVQGESNGHYDSEEAATAESLQDAACIDLNDICTGGKADGQEGISESASAPASVRQRSPKDSVQDQESDSDNPPLKELMAESNTEPDSMGERTEPSLCIEPRLSIVEIKEIKGPQGLGFAPDDAQRLDQMPDLESTPALEAIGAMETVEVQILDESEASSASTSLQITASNQGDPELASQPVAEQYSCEQIGSTEGMEMHEQLTRNGSSIAEPGKVAEASSGDSEEAGFEGPQELSGSLKRVTFQLPGDLVFFAFMVPAEWVEANDGQQVFASEEVAVH